ncbi:type IV secretion protein Rhs, partial [Pseudomonas sp. CFBP13506]
ARLVQRIDPDGAQHFKSYDDKGRLTVEQDPLGAVTAYQYDDAGRLVAVFPGDDEPTSYEHDNGFVRVVRRGEAVWKYERNDQGDVTRRTDPDGEVTDYSYNKYGQLTGVWYPDHSCHRLVWNERGQLIEQQLPNGGIKRYRYDNARLLLTEIENEVGETYRLAYHPNGLIQQEIGFDGQRTAYVYDLNGNLQEKTEHGDDGRQLVTVYQRDHAGRLVRKTL